MWNAEFKLHLYPVQPHYQISPTGLKSLLQALQFIGKPIPSQATSRYEVGEQFLSCLTFMGCSPNIELEPQADKPYCYIELESAKSPHFISGKNLKPAKCPHCKTSIKQLSCLNCHKPIDSEKLNWRKTAFYASSWISIGNIYALEAIPNDNLLTALEKEIGVKWKTAYIRHN